MIQVTCCASLILTAARLAASLPRHLATTGDSAAYLSQESFRPPLYGILLNGWRVLTGSIDHFALLQFALMMVGFLLFSIEIGRMFRNALVGAVMIPLLLMHPAIYDSPRFMMTEAVYLGLVLAGLAMQIRYVRRGGGGPLIAAALCFGLATLTRSTGFAFLPLPLLTACFDRRLTFGQSITRMGKPALTVALVLIVGMSWNYSRHHRFEIGSWAGLSLLQKSLILVQPGDVAGMPAPVAAVARVVVAERALIPAQPDLAARLRAHLQVTSSDLRWAVFIPDAEQPGVWPQWKAADWRTRGVLGGDVSRILIKRHFAGYLRVWRNDWLSLLLQPAYWPRWASSPVRDRNSFIACATQNSCWAIERYDLQPRSVIVLLAVSIGGPIAALFVILRFTGSVLRRTAAPDVVMMWAAAIVLHGSMALSSAFEAGHVRMTVAFHPLGLAIIVWLVACAMNRVSQRAWVGTLQRAASARG